MRFGMGVAAALAAEGGGGSGGMLELMPLGHHGHALGRNRQAPGEIALGIEADRHPGRHMHPLVDDRPANLGVATDVDALEENALLDPGEAVDPDAR